MFLTDLCVRADPQPDYWILKEDLIWVDPIFGKLVVPMGFRSDLESVDITIRNIPWVDSVFNENGVTRRPAVGHDFLYAWRGWGKSIADQFLRAAILAEGGSKATAAAVYWGVHLFGAKAWREDEGSINKYDFSTDATYQAWLLESKPKSFVAIP